MEYQRLSILTALALAGIQTSFARQGNAPMAWASPSDSEGNVMAKSIDADSLRYAFPPAFQAVTPHQSLDSLQAELKRQIEARRGKHYGCSAVSLTAIAATLGSVFSEKQLRSMSDSFSGGIGHKFSQGTCGALSGAIMALGFYASGDKEKHQRLAGEVYEEFKKQEGTVACGDIYGKFHFGRCNGCILCAVSKVVELLYREGDIQTNTVTPTFSPKGGEIVIYNNTI